jgi:hypothetical protein
VIVLATTLAQGACRSPVERIHRTLADNRCFHVSVANCDMLINYVLTFLLRGWTVTVPQSLGAGAP